MSAALYALGMLTGWCLAVAHGRLQRRARQASRAQVPTRARVSEGGPSLLQITARPAQWVASSKRVATSQHGDRKTDGCNRRLREVRGNQ